MQVEGVDAAVGHRMLDNPLESVRRHDRQTCNAVAFLCKSSVNSVGPLTVKALNMVTIRITLVTRCVALTAYCVEVVRAGIVSNGRGRKR